MCCTSSCVWFPAGAKDLWMKKLQRSWRGNAVTVTGRLVERKMDVLNHVTFANIVNGCVTTTWPAVMPSACSMNFWKWVGALSLLTTSSKKQLTDYRVSCFSHKWHPSENAWHVCAKVKCWRTVMSRCSLETNWISCSFCSSRHHWAPACPSFLS